MARLKLDDDSPANALSHRPTIRRNACFADGCKMPGAIFINGTSAPGCCAYHHAVAAHDVPRVTAALAEWGCLAYEVNEARRTLTGELATNPKAIDAAYAAAWQRLQPLVPGWERQLQPGNIVHFDDKGDPVPTNLREGYGDWAKRMEAFLGQRVVESLRGQIGRKAA